MIANLKDYKFFIVDNIITMGGGLMDLVAYGAQDIYLTGNPQITFFKVVYRRHTNFSMETIQQTIQGSSVIGSSETSGVVVISRNGDLLSDVFLASPTASLVLGDKIIKSVDLEIGGQLIDRQTATWMQIWDELTTPEEKQRKNQEVQIKKQEKVHNRKEDTQIANPNPSRSNAEFPFTYIVQRGDTLDKIAERYYGKKSEWKRIAENNDVSPRNLQIGQKLTIVGP